MPPPSARNRPKLWADGRPAKGANAQVKGQIRVNAGHAEISRRFSAGSGFESLMAHKLPGHRPASSAIVALATQNPPFTRL